LINYENPINGDYSVLNFDRTFDEVIVKIIFDGYDKIFLIGEKGSLYLMIKDLLVNKYIWLFAEKEDNEDKEEENNYKEKNSKSYKEQRILDMGLINFTEIVLEDSENEQVLDVVIYNDIIYF